MDDIRARLRELRARLGLSQRKFAEKMGMKHNTYQNIEVGVNPCSDRYINLICLTYGVHEDWLRDGSGEMLNLAPSAQKQPSEPLLDDNGKPLPPDVAELIAIYQELVPLNRESVLTFAETTLQSQRNTIRNMEDASKGDTGKGANQEASA